ncbi:MAG: sigma 54-interacting transcriptional regulator [Planctomycetes bacterium]|nr:sigma 54-interacting transcriptional regulator [Planctomycetota bacterium]
MRKPPPGPASANARSPCGGGPPRAVRPGRRLPAAPRLASGLLDAGEPAAALPFCGGLPALRARALCESGQIAAAQTELGRAPPSVRSDPEWRRVEARLALAAGRLDEVRRLLQRDDASPAEQLTLAAALEQSGELDASERLLQACAARLPAPPPPFLHASLQTALGHVRRQRGDLAAARDHFAAAAAQLGELGHARHAATALLNLGVVAKDLGDETAAIAHLREARALFLHCGDAANAARAAASLGIAALARGDAEAALPWLREGAAALRALGDEAAGQLAQAMLARAHAALGAADAARQALAGLGPPTSGRVRREIEQTEALLRQPPPNPAARETIMAETPADDRRTLFRTFVAVNRQLAQASDLDQALRHLLDAAVTLCGGRLGYLLIAHADGMRRELQTGDANQPALAFSRSLAHRAMELHRTLTGADALADRDLQDLPSIRNLQVRSAVCAPFRSAGGVRGAIYVEHGSRAGAFDEADKDVLEVLADQAAIAVDRMLRERALAQELSASQRELALVRRTTRRPPTQLLGDSPPMRDLRAQIDRLAPLDLPVLVLGETGTGKELVARALHELSPRHRGPFVAENCSALPAELMDRELFGHVQGAFTGADRDRPGLLELASGGTLFLDEVGDMPPLLQAKLLRALQERSIRRVGGSEQIPLDLRLLAATHKDLRAMVHRGEFREDLFFRLAAVELRVPPLRERGTDVVLLAEHFLRQHAASRGRTLRLSAVARAALAGHRWPGNVRELEHVMARAALLSDGEEVVDLQLPRDEAAAPPTSPDQVATLKAVERRAILAALQACGGDKAKTARALGISRTALYEKIKRHGLAD